MQLHSSRTSAAILAFHWISPLSFSLCFSPIYLYINIYIHTHTQSTHRPLTALQAEGGEEVLSHECTSSLPVMLHFSIDQFRLFQPVLEYYCDIQRKTINRAANIYPPTHILYNTSSLLLLHRVLFIVLL